MATATASSSSELNMKGPASQPSEAAIIQTFKGMRNELSRLAGKMSELEAEREEHRYVRTLFRKTHAV
jgi:hypothetical protein